MTGPVTKRSHFVPATYLRAWANADDQVVVRRRGSTKTYTPNVINVAVEAGLYGTGALGQSREEMFGSLEEVWPQLRGELINLGGNVSPDIRSQVSLFAGMQLTRTRERLAQVEFLSSFASFSECRPVTKDDIRSFLTERWLKFPPSEREVDGAWTMAAFALSKGGPPSKDEVMAMLLNIAIRELAPRLSSYHWTVEHCRKPILFTSDRPVMTWRPRSPRDKYEGIGLENAEEIRMPLTPNDLLVIRPIGLDRGVERVQPRRFERVNGAVSSQCYEFFVAAPSHVSDLQLVPLAAHRSVLRFDVAPGVRQLPDGRQEPIGDIMHMWLPTYADPDLGVTQQHRHYVSRLP
jgi:hypothetical protein